LASTLSTRFCFLCRLVRDFAVPVIVYRLKTTGTPSRTLATIVEWRRTRSQFPSSPVGRARTVPVDAYLD
jgi:hypothetical protein